MCLARFLQQREVATRRWIMTAGAPSVNAWAPSIAAERPLLAGTADNEPQLPGNPRIDDGFRAANWPAWLSSRDPKATFDPSTWCA
jgi:hypothetical protein